MSIETFLLCLMIFMVVMAAIGLSLGAWAYIRAKKDMRDMERRMDQSQLSRPKGFRL